MKISRNPWDVLGLAHGATPDEIKSAYKRKAMSAHPDKGGSPENFKLLTDAYNQLKNRKHIPVLSKPDTRLVNVRLTIEQQVNGVEGIIDTDAGALEVKIPKGACANDKFKIRCNGKNYIINIKEQKDNIFTRHGYDVIMELELDIVDAMLGNNVSITGPCNNIIELQIEPGTQSNTQIVIDDEGLYNRKLNRRGNLHIFTKITIPELDTQTKIQEFKTRFNNGNRTDSSTSD